MRAPEKHRRRKPLESVIQLKMPACLPHHPPVPPQVRLPLLQLRSEWGWGGGSMVAFDPWGRQRWKECVVQPVNTLTWGGDFLLAAFPTIPKPLQLHMEEGKSGGGGEGCRAMEKVLDGTKKRERKKVGGQKKRLILMWKKQTLR